MNLSSVGSADYVCSSSFRWPMISNNSRSALLGSVTFFGSPPSSGGSSMADCPKASVEMIVAKPSSKMNARLIVSPRNVSLSLPS